jgi:succinate dehydrogenase flavin-adding protein (antitoxin of CptAB toxin-antitoxin module)
MTQTSQRTSLQTPKRPNPCVLNVSFFCWQSVPAHTLHPLFRDARAYSLLLTQRINRLLYRARQRGWLELDLLVGLWAERCVPSLSEAQLDDFEALLNQENPELYKWLTGQIEPPESMQSNAAFQVSFEL